MNMHPDDMKESGLLSGHRACFGPNGAEPLSNALKVRSPGNDFCPLDRPLSSHGQMTDGTGMPTSKGWEVESAIALDLPAEPVVRETGKGAKGSMGISETDREDETFSNLGFAEDGRTGSQGRSTPDVPSRAASAGLPRPGAGLNLRRAARFGRNQGRVQRNMSLTIVKNATCVLRLRL
jgi:hypothetical protein